ncbi:MAG TPA: TonB-dependent receptor [Polyangiaceae bacterium]|nr:TonB-dependent receptor [Polyangiaceae bacterium]
MAGAVLAFACFAQRASAEGAPGIAAPVRVDDADAIYPSGAHGEASVSLELEIAEDGTVGKARVTEGSEPFASAALRAAENFRFTPATRNGIPIRARILAKISFHEPFVEPAPPAPAPSAAGTAPASAPLATTATPAAGSPPAPMEITVLGEQREELGSIHIPKNETRLIPGAFADPFRVVEILPGVAPILSGLPYFFVRGAPPGDVGYFIDGIRVPLLFHVGAGPSVIAPALADRVDLYPSAYPARFGRFVGGIMAGETTPPSQVGRGEAQARVFDAGAMLETPFAEGRGSILLGGRYSYTQALLALVAPDYELGYADYQARIAYSLNAHDQVSAFLFGAYDKLENKPLDLSLFDVSFQRLDLRWDHLTEGGHTRVALTGGADRVQNAQEDPNGSAGQLNSDGLRVRLESEQRITSEVRVRGGADFGGDQIGADREKLGLSEVVYPGRTDWSGGVYSDAILRPTRGVELVPGVRFDVARSRGKDYGFSEPRLSARLRLAQGVAWISAFGVAHQLPTSSVHVPGLAPSALELSEQESWQASEGVQFVLPSAMLSKLTVFYSRIDSRETELVGRNFGFELFLRRDFTEKLGGFLSYTLSRTERSFGSVTELSSFDRTHVVSAVLGYDLGKGFRVGGRAYYTSGRPYFADCGTPDCGPGDPAGPRPYLHSGQLPHFLRVDVRFEKRWRFASGAWLAGTFEWFNALLASETQNILWDPVRGGLRPDVRSPLTLPSIGIEAGY